LFFDAVYAASLHKVAVTMVPCATTGSVFF
jgi:hypothetical protein